MVDKILTCILLLSLSFVSVAQTRSPKPAAPPAQTQPATAQTEPATAQTAPADVQEQAEPQQPVAPKGRSHTLDKIQSGEGFTIGVLENALPFATMGKDKDNPSGYSIDICNRVVRNMEKNLGKSIPIKYVGVNAKNRMEMLKNNTIDMECGKTTDTVSHEREVSFSYPFFVSGIRMAVRKTSKYKDYGDLANATVLVVDGSIAEELVRNLEKTMRAANRTFDIRTVKNNDEGILGVSSQQGDAFMADDVMLAGAIMVNKLQDQLERTGRNLSAEPYAIMMRKGDDAFVNEVDKALVPVLTGGEAEKYIKQWFDTPALRYGINHMTQSVFSVPAKYPAFP